MSTTEHEEAEEVEVIEEPALLPATELDDLFEDETELEEPEIPDDLSEDELRRRLVSAEKRAAFERDQRVKTARKTWIAEAKEHFPYSAPEKITADSRRSFLEEAKKQDADFRERAEPLLTKTQETEEKMRERIRKELEAEAAAAFGRPTVGSGGGASEPAKQEDVDKRLDSARKSRDLIGATKALMDGRRI